MFLSSEKIKQAVNSGDLIIFPFFDENLKPASYNFTLDETLKDPLTGKEIIIPSQGYVLKPGSFVLGKTRERVNLKGNYLCILGTRSAFAQKGVDVLQSSTIAEPDTDGQFTLEISNHGPEEVIVFRNQKAVKGIFCKLKP